MSTILWQGIIFGPIRSRRLGTSLGVNLLPSSGKVCNFDCIYCECGWNREGRTSEAIPSFETVKFEMESKLSQLHSEGTVIDTITFSGNGEPTLHPDFSEIIDFTLKMRDKFYPEAKVSVLSNATTIDNEGIRNALMKIDNPILKLDGGDDGLIFRLNKPQKKYSLKKTVDGLKRFNGKFILQTMFLRGVSDGREIDCTNNELVCKWIETVLELRPEMVMIYTIDRETPEKNLQKVSVEEMESIAGSLRKAGIEVQVRG